MSDDAGNKEARTPGGDTPFGSDVVTQFDDALFRTKKKHKIRTVPAPQPALEAPVADTHIHLAMLRDPAKSIVRAAVHGVSFIGCMADPASAADVVYDQIDSWFAHAEDYLKRIDPESTATLPAYRISCGVHPHDARLYTPEMEQQLLAYWRDSRTSCVGEIGLDYHYDFSPREVQREVFARQVELMHETGLPLTLHLREAHDDALGIMDEVGFPEAGTILHCFNLGVEELMPWVERGCYIAVGGAVTFGSSERLREALSSIPRDKFLFETDGPFMAPTPFRSVECGPDLIVFTAAYIAEQLGYAPGEERARFLSDVYYNSVELLNREVTPWQSAQ